MTRRRALATTTLGALALLTAGAMTPSYAARVPVESPGDGIRALPLAPPPGSPAPPDACLLQVAHRPAPAPRGSTPWGSTPPYTGGQLEACRPPVGPVEGRVVPVLPAPGLPGPGSLGSPGLEARR